jgi:transposase InsO family protein
VKFAFIEGHLAGQFPVGVCCDVLGVSRSGYYARRDRPDSARAKRRQELAAKVKAVHQENRGVYGSPRVFRALKARGESACENTVAKVMREQEIRARGKKKFVPRTTDSGHGRPVAGNVLGREFRAELPDRKWAADITYVPRWGWRSPAARPAEGCCTTVTGESSTPARITGICYNRMGSSAA